MGVVRMCVGCRQREATSSLLRCVVEGVRVVPDVSRTIPGRGAWVHPQQRCVTAALKREAFPRALKRSRGLDVSTIEAFFTKENRLNG